MAYSKNGNIKVAFDFYTKEKGYAPHVATGIIGHLLDESNLNPNGPLGDGGKAFGIAQWHPDRQALLKRHAQELGLSHTDLKAQLSFVDWELKNTEKKAGDRLFAAKTPSEAAAAFAGYERFAGWEQGAASKRFRSSDNHARNLYGLFTGESVPEFQTASFGVAPGAAEDRARMTGLNAGAVISDYERTKTAFDRQEKDPGFMDASGAALRLGQTAYYLWQSPPSANADTSYSISRDQEWFKEATKTVPTEYLSGFSQAHSRQHVEWMKERIAAKMEDEKTLSDYGLAGHGLRFASEMLDPVALLAGAGIGKLIQGSVAAGRLGGAIVGAASGVGGNAAVDALRAPSDPTYGAEDALWSLGAGLVFGGALGAIFKNPANRDLGPGMMQIGKSLVDEADARMVPGGSTAGAMHLPSNEPLRTGTWDLLSALDDEVAPKSFAGAWRYSLAARLGSSENPMSRMLGNVLVADGAGARKGKTAEIAVDQRAGQIRAEATMQWRQATEPAFDKWAEEQGIGVLQKPYARRKFFEEVYDAVQNESPLRQFHPEVEKVAAAHRQIMAHLHDIQANPGLIDGGTYRPVRGYGPENKIPNYIPRQTDAARVDQSLDTYRLEPVKDFVIQAMKSVTPKIKDDIAKAIANAWVRRARETAAGMNRGVYKAFAGEDLDLLKETLEQTGGLKPDEIEGVLRMFSKPDGDKGNVNHARQRVLLNEQFEGRLFNYKTQQWDTVRFSDLFLQKDVDQLFASYVHDASSNTALAMVKVRNPRWAPDAEGMDEFLVDGITNKSEFQSLLENVKGVAAEMKLDPSKDVKRLQFAYDHITGVPHHLEQEGVGRGLRMLRAYNYLRMMGQVGLAQIPEFMNTVSTFGIRALIHSVPDFKGIIRNAETGKLSNELLNELESFTGVGADWMRSAAHIRFDDPGQPLAPGRNQIDRTLDNAEVGLAQASRAQTAVSLMAPVNAFLQRSTLTMMSHKLADIAAKGGKASDDIQNRLKTVGVDEKMLKRITDQMKKNSIWDKNEISGKNIRRLNLEGWDDIEAASHLKMAMYQWSRRIIQENDVGNMAMWMTHPIAKAMLQFRTFMIAAWDKQFMYNLNMRDWTSFQYMSMGMFAGGLTYVGQTYVQSIGRDDSSEFLKKRLSSEGIAGAAFQRWAGSAILPMAADSLFAPFNEGKPIFQGRHTELPSQAIMGSPTVDAFDKGIKSVQSGFEVGTGRGVNKNDAFNWKSLAPFQNTIPAVLLFNGMTNGLPDAPRK